VFAILLGAGLEGEAVVLTGGILAREGLIPLVPACIAAAVGSCVVDQIWFFVGRRASGQRWVRAVTDRPGYARAIRLLDRYPTSFILAFRFIYGLRTVSPIAIGTSRVPTRRFVLLNMVAAAVWGPAFTLIGYKLGEAVVPRLKHLTHVGAVIVGAAALMIALAFLVRWWVRRPRAV
jgi:membrane protein DedA with SNARE-associated domain